MTGAGKPEGDEAGGGSLAGALAGFLDHFFATWQKSAWLRDRNTRCAWPEPSGHLDQRHVRRPERNYRMKNRAAVAIEAKEPLEIV